MNWKKKFKVPKIKFINAIQVHVYMLHRINLLLGTKLGFFRSRSKFLLAHASLWPERSGATK